MSEFAGTLTERVMQLRRTGVRDALGGASGAWTPVAILWAAMEPLGPGPEVRGEAIEALPRWRVTARRTDVTVGDRLSWGGRTLAVRVLRLDPRTPDRIEIEAEEER